MADRPTEPRTAATTDDEPAAVPAPSAPLLVEQELLIEDVSIDGMCGVY